MKTYCRYDDLFAFLHSQVARYQWFSHFLQSCLDNLWVICGLEILNHFANIFCHTCICNLIFVASGLSFALRPVWCLSGLCIFKHFISVFCAQPGRGGPRNHTTWYQDLQNDWSWFPFTMLNHFSMFHYYLKLRVQVMNSCKTMSNKACEY